MSTGIFPTWAKPWPQTQPPSGDLVYKYPNHTTRGFLPPLYIPPLIETKPGEQSQDPLAANKIGKKFGQYIYTDWRGQVLNLVEGTGLAVGETRDKFDVSRDLPKTTQELVSKPYTTRDHYLIFGDTSQDYFRHGLQILDGLNTTPSAEFWETQKNRESAGRTSLLSFKGTPFENSDPVIFGFDIIFDDISSPLLNGSINDFLQLFSGNISEVAARIPVYEEFKQQFVKFFKTRATVRIDEGLTNITSTGARVFANAENRTNLFNSGKRAYMNYYLKKVTGLAKLIESNTAAEKNFITDYNKDIITLSFSEDVSLSIGTLAHLYKLLYWSKPNAKTIIPENLLRFNCDIVVSEVRNYNRVRRSLQTGDLEVVKDNVSRYIYSLRECQFYFNTLPHDDTIDLGSIKTFESYDIQFDYKYSTVKFERFIPTSTGGAYAGYDGGALWKIGTPGNRATGSSASKLGKSVPAFFTFGSNRYNQNGVNIPIVMSMPGKTSFNANFDVETQGQDFQSGDVGSGQDLSGLQQRSKFVKRTAEELKEISAQSTKPLIDGIEFTGVTTAADYLLEQELAETFDARSQINSSDYTKEFLEREKYKIFNDQVPRFQEKLYTLNGTKFVEGSLPQQQVLNLYGSESRQLTSTEEALKKQQQGQKLGTTLLNALKREAQTAVNTRVGLLNKSLNKILNSVGVTGVSPPKNIYTGTDTAAGRIFRDVRGQLITFLGNSSGNLFS